jgi:hypothetical protein
MDIEVKPVGPWRGRARSPSISRIPGSAVVLPTELLSVNEPGKLPMRGKAALRRQLVNQAR